MPVVQLELAAISRDFDELTAAAKARYFERDLAAYQEALAKWQAHDRANPGRPGWRAKPVTREQWFVIDHIVSAKSVPAPSARQMRGEAHDWIEAHGGNPRYAADSKPTLSSERPSVAAKGSEAGPETTP